MQPSFLAPRLAVLSALAGLLTAPSLAELRLPAVFSNGMVLQQRDAVAVWGRADPGEEVKVRGSWSDASTGGSKATADETGRWTLELGTPAAGGPFTLTVTSPTESIEIEDVLIGEVWLCSGQSNMEMELRSTVEAGRASGVLAQATADIARPDVRFFRVARKTSVTPLDDCDARWVAAVGDDALRCSAVAYYFACRLQDELHVPIGLVEPAWGGTRAEAWTSEEVVTQFPHHASSLERVKNLGDGDRSGEVAAFWSAVDDAAFWTRRFSARTFDDSAWQTQDQPCSFEDGPFGAHDGVVWYRRTIEIPAGWAGREVVLGFPPIDDLDETFWNGVSVGTTVESGGWSKPRRYVVPASAVTAGRATIAIRALDTGGAGGFGETDKTPALRATCGDQVLDLTGPWRVRKGPIARGLPAAPLPVGIDQHTPAALFNGMIAPLVPYGIRGVTWYQGESNRYRAEEYRTLFPAMIVDWRTRWNDLELPFYFVQLAPFDYGANDADGRTAIVREAQADVVGGLPHTGMALTADVGNPRDIHPIDKWTVGDRLARLALRGPYGRADVVAVGPTFKSTTTYGPQLRVDFDHVAGSLSVIGEALAHFEIAGVDGKFVPAEASITNDGVAVVLHAEGITAPTRARYLWNDAGEATLMGGAGLPAAPFRSR